MHQVVGKKVVSSLLAVTCLLVSSAKTLGQENRGVAGGPVRSILDIPYVASGEHKQQLDLFLPSGSGFPSLLLVHGGSLQSGDRKDTSEPYGEICEAFARAGIACAAISYRLFPTVDWPAPAEDVAAAFAWLRGNVGEYGGTTKDTFILGHSSGCTLASVVAGDASYLAAHGLSSTDIAGVLAMGCRLNNRVDIDGVERALVEMPARVERYFSEDAWGARFGSLEALQSFLPMNFVGAHLPPTLVLIAEAERFEPPILEDAELFVEAARRAGADAEIVILPDRKHYSSVRLLVSAEDPTFRIIVGFVRRRALGESS